MTHQPELGEDVSLRWCYAAITHFDGETIHRSLDHPEDSSGTYSWKYFPLLHNSRSDHDNGRVHLNEFTSTATRLTPANFTPMLGDTRDMTRRISS